MRYSDTILTLTTALPHATIRIGKAQFAEDRLWLLGIACAITAVLYVISRWTLVGLATSAVAENERSAAAAGWSPDVIANINWALGAGLAGVAGILIAPITTLVVTNLNLLVIPAMAVALVAGFKSYPLALAGGVAIGIAESELTNYASTPGVPQAVPFIAIVLLLIVRGQSLPLRGHLLERLPTLGTGRFNPRVVVPLVIAVAAITLTVPVDWADALGTSFVGAVMLMSVVVLTGYAGNSRWPSTP